jgi:hypothetical protein
MTRYKLQLMALAAIVAMATSACNGGSTVPLASSAGANGAAQLAARGASPDDTTSILKKLTKDVVIGSTVDPTNGDMGPRGLSYAKINYGLKKGQLAVCNFENSAGAAGKGTTIELLNPTTGSKPTTFVQSSQIEGCADDVVSNNNGIYATGLTSGMLVGYDNKGKLVKSYGSPFKAPFYDVDASCPAKSSFCGYSAEYIFGSDAKTGGIVSFSINGYGNPKETQVANGFALNHKSGWSALGPSGLSYDPKKDTLYIADGVDNTIVSFNNASELLVTDEITVLKGGKKFKCKYESTTCGTLVLAGSPLAHPVAMTILPNGNLIAADSKGTTGGATLVEVTPSGQVLDTKVIDSTEAPGIFGLLAKGTNDDNTVLYYTDTNDNSLHELEQ